MEPYKPEGSKAKIIEAAINLFSVKGFTGTSIRDIGRITGMSISNIYHYFGNKEGLWLAILEMSTNEILGALRKISALDMEPLARFELIIETHVGQATDHLKKAKIFQMDEEHLTEDGDKINKQLQRKILNIYVEELRNLEEAGHVKCRSINVLALNILGVINWILLWYRPKGPLSLEEISQEIVSFVMHGILGAEESGK